MKIIIIKRIIRKTSLRNGNDLLLGYKVILFFNSIPFFLCFFFIFLIPLPSLWYLCWFGLAACTLPLPLPQMNRAIRDHRMAKSANSTRINLFFSSNFLKLYLFVWWFFPCPPPSPSPANLAREWLMWCEEANIHLFFHPA